MLQVLSIMNDIIKLGKKAFTVGVVATTILWSVGAAALVPSVAKAADLCPALYAGDMIKVEGVKTIYAINSNLEVISFTDGYAFKTWNVVETYAGLYKSITQDCYDSLKTVTFKPLFVGFRPGSAVIQRVGSDKLYVVLPNTTKAEISLDAAKGLYGANFTKMMVQNEHWDSVYTSDATMISTVKAHQGMFVSKDSKTYYVDAGNTLVEVTDAGLAANRIKPAYVRALPASATEGYTIGSEVISAYSAKLGDRTQTAVSGGSTVPVASGSLTVTLASDTPSGTYAIKSAARVPFTKVNFSAGSADVTIDSFKVKREGAPAVDADFSKINVVKPNGDLLNDSGKTLNSDHEATFTEDIVIPANTTQTYTLVGDMSASLTSGNVPKLSLVSMVTTASTVGLPVVGNAVTTNANVALGTVTLEEGSSIGTVTKQVGSANVNLANLKITVVTDDFQVGRITFYNSGTVADADVTNLKLTYNNNTIATGVMKDKYVTFDLSSCTDDCKILKGNNKTYAVYGDLMSGSGRNVNLDVQYATHVLAKDLTYNYYVTPTNSASGMTNTVSISQGKLNVTKTDTVPAGNVPANSSGTALASWNFKVTGEPIDVKTLVFKITTTGTVKPEGLDALVLYDASGKALIGSVDGVGAVVGVGYATSTDTITFPVGDNFVTLKANIDNTAVAGDTISIGIDMANSTNFSATGVNSSQTIDLATYATPQSVVTANTKTVQASALSVTTLSNPAPRTYAPGTSGVVFAKVMLDASNSSEDMKVTQFKISDTTASGAKTIDIQNIRLWVDLDGDSYDGDNTLTQLAEVNSGSDSDANDPEVFTYNLSGTDQFVVKAGKKVVVEVLGDIAGGASTGSHTFAVATANYITAMGQTTNNEVTETISAAAGQAMSIGTSGGQVEVSLASSNPSAKLLAAGSTVTLGSFKFYATTTENVELDYIYLTQLVTTAASSSYKDYDYIWFENESGVEVSGTRMSPTSTKPLVDFASGAFVVDVADSDGAVLTLKASLATIGTGYNGVSSHQVGYKINAIGDVVAKGAQSGNATNEFFGTSVPTGNTHYVFKGYPVFEKLAVSSNILSNGTKDLFKFKVTAVNSDIALYGFTFDIATTGCSVGSLYVYDVTGTETVLNETAGAADLGVWQTVGTDWTASYSADEVTVATASPRTFVLRGNVSGASSSDSITTSLAGDSAYTMALSAGDVDGLVHDDFIWSDKSAGSHGVATTDWVNGYLVSGLPSSSSTPETLSL